MFEIKCITEFVYMWSTFRVYSNSLEWTEKQTHGRFILIKLIFILCFYLQIIINENKTIYKKETNKRKKIYHWMEEYVLCFYSEHIFLCHGIFEPLLSYQLICLKLSFFAEKFQWNVKINIRIRITEIYPKSRNNKIKIRRETHLYTN